MNQRHESYLFNKESLCLSIFALDWRDFEGFSCGHRLVTCHRKSQNLRDFQSFKFKLWNSNVCDGLLGQTEVKVLDSPRCRWTHSPEHMTNMTNSRTVGQASGLCPTCSADGNRRGQLESCLFQWKAFQFGFVADRIDCAPLKRTVKRRKKLSKLCTIWFPPISSQICFRWKFCLDVGV